MLRRQDVLRQMALDPAGMRELSIAVSRMQGSICGIMV